MVKKDWRIFVTLQLLSYLFFMNCYGADEDEDDAPPDGISYKFSKRVWSVC